ncbi:MAG: nucleotidyltransferase [Ruminococcaceae bacterium]|nr:nucleotidyltransferase [Oscillospiraceae bacterium]
MSNFNTTLVVMAAGMGSRFGGLKQLEPIGANGEVLLDYSVYDAQKAGFNKVVFVIKHAIEKDFRELVGKRIEKKIDVDYAFQELDKLPSGFTVPADREKPWGTGHAVLCCKEFVNQPFAAINADDFYGASAYRQINNCLAKQSGDYCMVGFRLKNTLTDNGTVARGVCETNSSNHLTNITEITNIKDCAYEDENGKKIILPPDTVVSMNMWGFTTDLFGYLEEGFNKFLTEKINVPKSEYFLPFQIDELIKKGEKQVEVLVAEDKWYGMTYKEDKPVVKAAISEMTKNGQYDGI